MSNLCIWWKSFTYQNLGVVLRAGSFVFQWWLLTSKIFFLLEALEGFGWFWFRACDLTNRWPLYRLCFSWKWATFRRKVGYILKTRNEECIARLGLLSLQETRRPSILFFPKTNPIDDLPGCYWYLVSRVSLLFDHARPSDQHEEEMFVSWSTIHFQLLLESAQRASELILNGPATWSEGVSMLRCFSFLRVWLLSVFLSCCFLFPYLNLCFRRFLVGVFDLSF